MTVLVSENGRYAKPTRGSKFFFQGKRRVSGQLASLAVRNGVQGTPPIGPFDTGQALIEVRNPGAVIFCASGSEGMMTRPVMGTVRSKFVMLKVSSLNGGWYS